MLHIHLNSFKSRTQLIWTNISPIIIIISFSNTIPYYSRLPDRPLPLEVCVDGRPALGGESSLVPRCLVRRHGGPLVGVGHSLATLLLPNGVRESVEKQGNGRQISMSAASKSVFLEFWIFHDRDG